MSIDRDNWFVTTDWLEENLNDRTTRVVDVTAMLAQNLENIARDCVYDQGHIPGAIFLDVASGRGPLADPDAPLPITWPSKERVEAAMATVGVGSDTRVLIYASTPRPGVDYGPMWSTRAWWLLHHFGVNCAILDGGYEKWIAEGRPTSTEVTNPGSGNFETNSDSLHALATKDDVLAALGAAPTCVVDAVSEESYAGRKPSAGVKRNGHITGAINVPLYDLITEDFTFADPITLANRFAVSQVPVHGPVITYCGGGVAATLDAFALKLLGCRDVRVYDGSLQEWSADEALPMSTDGNR